MFMRIIGWYFVLAFFGLAAVGFYGSDHTTREVVEFLAVLHGVVASLLWAGIILGRAQSDLENSG